MTSRAPVPAAEIGQPRQRWHSGGRRRLRELELGLSLARRGTSRQPETTQRRTRGPGPCRCRRHGALPPFHPSPATWSSSRPRPPQVSGAQLWSRCGCPSRATAASPSRCYQPRSRRPQLRSSLQGPVRAFAGPHCLRLESQVCAPGRGHGTSRPELGRATLEALGLEAKPRASGA